MSQITICTGTYRGCASLARALRSIREGGFTGPVIVGDDGSAGAGALGLSDGMRNLELASFYGATFVAAAANTGWPSNYNRMAMQVQTPYTLYLDNDAIYPRGLAELAVALLEKIHYAGMLTWVSRNITPQRAQELSMSGYTPDDEGKDQQPEFDTELAAFCSAHHTKRLREYRFDEAFRFYFADSEMAIRMAHAAYPSFRIHWPRIPHVEHSTIHVFSELNGDAGRDKDRETFRAKYGIDPPQVRDRLLEGGVDWKHERELIFKTINERG